MPTWLDKILNSQFVMIGLAGLAFLIALWLVVVIVRMMTGGRLRFNGGRTRQARLGIVDAFDLDRQRQLIIVRRDNTEHLIMIGGPNDLVIESEIVRVEARENRRASDKAEGFADTRIPAPTMAPEGGSDAAEEPLPPLPPLSLPLPAAERPSVAAMTPVQPTLEPLPPRAPTFPLPPRRPAPQPERRPPPPPESVSRDEPAPAIPAPAPPAPPPAPPAPPPPPAATAPQDPTPFPAPYVPPAADCAIASPCALPPPSFLKPLPPPIPPHPLPLRSRRRQVDSTCRSRRCDRRRRSCSASRWRQVRPPSPAPVQEDAHAADRVPPAPSQQCPSRRPPAAGNSRPACAARKCRRRRLEAPPLSPPPTELRQRPSRRRSPPRPNRTSPTRWSLSKRRWPSCSGAAEQGRRRVGGSGCSAQFG